MSAPIIWATLAANLSLSPYFISLVAVESFSFTTGIALILNKLSKVLLTFIALLLCSVSSGLIKINGNFKKGENVIILDQNNVQLARGLSSFSSTEIDKIKGKQSKEIETILGYLSKTEVIHKDDMVLL